MSVKIDEKFPANITYLLVEDMDSIRVQMKNDLRTLGVTGTILEAACVADAIKIIQSEKIQFVICDWNLPDGTGLNLLIKFRAVKAYANIPFVMCTTMNEIGNILEAIKAGANEYIVKPWQIDELQKKIKLTWNLKK
jgi:two-component system chemotaxis response regulator CheY